MHAHKQLLHVLQNQSIVSMQALKESLLFSERKIRAILKDLRGDERKNGFAIVTVSKEGYYLKVTDEDRFKIYLDRLEKQEDYDVGRKDFRVALILFLLLQTEGYTSRGQIAELLDVSRNTVVNDMPEIKRELQKYALDLESRPHYGIRIRGEEQDIRRMLSRISGILLDEQALPLEFFTFTAELNFQEERETFLTLLHQYDISLSNNAIESILFHLKILLYRIFQDNYVSDIHINRDMIHDAAYQITRDMLAFIEKKYRKRIPKEEYDLLASQIFGKAGSVGIPPEQQRRMMDSIDATLQKVDQDYATDYRQDDVLRENLLLHVCPLILRVASGLELNDSLLSTVSIQYMNAFLVAMRFIYYHPDLQNHSLSRDEIGYLALHFATHTERKNQQRLQKIRKIVLVAGRGGSATSLLKAKLKNHFPYANILALAYSQAIHHAMEDIELVVSTTDIAIPHKDAKLVVISESLTEQDIRKIKNKVLFGDMDFVNSALRLENLFFEDLFEVCEQGEYIPLIRSMCERMIERGYAQPGFTESVLNREARFTTIVENGIASPHGLLQTANIDSIGVILLKKAAWHEGKEVRCIFLINTRKGHLLMQQSISDFIMQLMDDRNNVLCLQQADTYREFKMFIQDIL